MASIRRCALLMSAAWALAGCSTPRPALDLAAQGALVVDQAQAEVHGFVDRSARSYKQREDSVRLLARSDIVDTSRTDFRTWASKETGGPDQDAERAERIKQIAARSRATRDKLAADLAARSQAIDAVRGSPVSVPAEQMAAAKKAFLSLAQELSAEEWLQFSRKYAKELHDNIKKLKSPAPADAASAASTPR